jgi:aspartate 1-decarboxylase
MTYLLPGERGKGMVYINGGSASHAKVGDTYHVLTFCSLNDEELETFMPVVVLQMKTTNLSTLKNIHNL